MPDQVVADVVVSLTWTCRLHSSFPLAEMAPVAFLAMGFEKPPAGRWAFRGIVRAHQQLAVDLPDLESAGGAGTLYDRFAKILRPLRPSSWLASASKPSGQPGRS